MSDQQAIPAIDRAIVAEDISADHRTTTVGPFDAPVIVVRANERVEFPQEALDYAEARQERPREKTGRFLFQNAASFALYVLSHMREETALWANARTDGGPSTVTAIMDGHGKLPGWARHTAIFSATHSIEWQQWAAKLGKSLSQEDLAAFIEDNATDVLSVDGMPTGLELVEVARNLRVNTKGTFMKQFVKATGEYHLVCKNELESESTRVPPKFMIGIPVFEGAVRDQCEISLSFVVGQSGAMFTMQMARKERIVRTAFEDVLRDLEKNLPTAPLYIGSPT